MLLDQQSSKASGEGRHQENRSNLGRREGSIGAGAGAGCCVSRSSSTSRGGCRRINGILLELRQLGVIGWVHCEHLTLIKQLVPLPRWDE
jgi:hypothetical protein